MARVQGVGTQLQLPIRLVEEYYQRYGNDNENRCKDYVDFVHSGLEHSW